MNKVLAIIINPTALLINLITAIVCAFIDTYKDNIKVFESLER